MGVNISVVDMRTFTDVKGWDYLRHAGDRDAAKILDSLPHTNVLYGHEIDGTYFLRPDDVEQFRAALHAAFAHNTERWDQMCDMLAADENRGLYFS